MTERLSDERLEQIAYRDRPTPASPLPMPTAPEVHAMARELIALRQEVAELQAECNTSRDRLQALAQVTLTTLRQPRDQTIQDLEYNVESLLRERDLIEQMLGVYDTPLTAVAALKEMLAERTTLQQEVAELREQRPDDLKIPCMYCGKLWRFTQSSKEAQGIFNVFCRDKDCEDRYAATL